MVRGSDRPKDRTATSGRDEQHDTDAQALAEQDDPLLPELKALQHVLYVRFKERGEESKLVRFMLRRTLSCQSSKQFAPFNLPLPLTSHIAVRASLRRMYWDYHVQVEPVSEMPVSRTAKTFDSVSWPCYRRVPVLL
jgi:hypothetical protein